MSWFAVAVCSLALAWLTAVAVLALGQRRLLYLPGPAAPDPAAAGFPWLRPVSLDQRLLGWWQAPPSDKGSVLVYFHGNRGTLARIAAKAAPWRRFGLGLFAVTYRGYEGNPGQPSEEGLYADARAALDWLAERGIGPDRLILCGESLGSGLAAQMAEERPVRGLILECPFTSIPDVAAFHYPWVPARRMVRDRFDSLAKIGGLTMPILILHGDCDPTVPVAHSRRLAEAAPPGTTLAVIPGGRHIDLFDKGAEPFLEVFLRRLNSTSP